MKTRARKDKQEPMQAPAAAPAPTPELQEDNPQMEGIRKSIAIYFGDDGKVQWNRMREASREQLKEIVTNKEIQSAFGIAEMTPTVEAQVVKFFDAEWCGALYGTIGMIEQVVAVKFMGVTPEIARACFTYSKAEIDKLSGPTEKVINKYASDWMIRFKDEIALAMLFISITAAKAVALKAMMAVSQISKPPAPTPATVPAPVAEPAANSENGQKAA